MKAFKDGGTLIGFIRIARVKGTREWRALGIGGQTLGEGTRDEMVALAELINAAPLLP